MPNKVALQNDPLTSKSNHVLNEELLEKSSQLKRDSSHQNSLEKNNIPSRHRTDAIFFAVYKITSTIRTVILHYLKACWNNFSYLDFLAMSEMDELNYGTVCREILEIENESPVILTEHDHWMSAYERERSLYQMACSWTEQTKENELELEAKKKKMSNNAKFSKKHMSLKRDKAFQKLIEKNIKTNYLRSEDDDSNQPPVNQRIRHAVSRKRQERRARAATRALDRCMAEYLAHGSPELDAAAAEAAAAATATSSVKSNLSILPKKRDQHKSFLKEQQNRLRRGSRPQCHQPFMSLANVMSPGVLYCNPLDFSLDKQLLIPCRIHPWQLNINESAEESQALPAKTCVPSFEEAELPLGNTAPPCQFHTISD